MNKKYKVAIGDGDRLTAVSSTVQPTIPPGLYRYDLNPMGMNFFLQSVEQSRIKLDRVQQAIFDRIQLFWSSRDRYRQMSFPHKRGYLMYGPPGTGKTTLLRYIISKHIEQGGVVLEAQNIRELPEAVQAIRDLNDGCRIVVLFEDVEDYDDEILTNYLDGIGQQDNILFLATTNYIDQVPDRLANRPSRFDEAIELGYPDESIRVGFLDMFEFDQKIKDTLAAISGEMSQAHLKELVIQSQIFDKTLEDIRGLAGKFQEKCADTK